MATTNPIRLVHEKIWAMLRANSDLLGATGLVTAPNQVDYTVSTRVPPRDVVTEGKTPEMEVVASSMRPHLQETSSGSSLVVRWEIRVTSGSELFANLMDIEWETYRAMEDWETHFSVLTWAEKRFVTLCRPLASRDTLGTPMSRGIRGWVCVWACETQLDFTTSDIAVGA